MAPSCPLDTALQLLKYFLIYCTIIPGWTLIENILFCHVLWWLFYYFLLVVTKQSEEWCCRFLTLVHGCLISYSAIKEIIIFRIPVDFQCIPLSPAKKNYLSYMLSYFLFDFCWIHFFGNETWVIYAHHIASIMIIVHVLLKNYGGGGVSYGIAGLEFTNPYLQLRWFFRTHGYLNKPVHTITELWFMLLFFLIRMVGGTILLYYALMNSNIDSGMKFCFLSIYGISLVLQWQIFVYFRKKYLLSRRLANVNFITSRISISPYFQRRTLDNLDSQDTLESKTTEEPGSPAIAESPSMKTNDSIPKAAESPTVKSRTSSAKASETLAVSSPKSPSPRSERSAAPPDTSEIENPDED